MSFFMNSYTIWIIQLARITTFLPSSNNGSIECVVTWHRYWLLCNLYLRGGSEIISHFERLQRSQYLCHVTTHSMLPLLLLGMKGRDPGELYYNIWCSYSWRNSSDIRFKQFQWQSWDILWDGRVPLSTGCRTTVYTMGYHLHTGIVSMSAPLIFTLFIKFSLTEVCCVRIIGGNGSDNGQFIRPCQLTTDSIGRVFIADYGNHRICMHDPDLNHLRNITYESMSEPSDVKVSATTVSSYCVLISTRMDARR